ncbi:unnamed protein product [Prunus armeniaca]|uniref:Uncharacterized protein n=1 Tax=Prunus armeniaca TaxID=36596 RepID=A0A6J5Y7P2_PRUAR|nr:unnamed protein product [Prunus armeniaca]
MSETLSTIFEESSASSSTLENFQEEGAQQLHETDVSFESCTDGESSPPLPPGLTKLNTTIRLGLYSKVKFCNKENTVTSDIDPAETTPSMNDPNSSRSFNKSINFSRFTSFFRPNATSPSRQHLIMIIMIFMMIKMRCLPYVRGLLLQRFLWKSSNWRLILYVRRPWKQEVCCKS